MGPAWSVKVLLTLGLLHLLLPAQASLTCSSSTDRDTYLNAHFLPDSCWTALTYNDVQYIYDITRLINNHGHGGNRVLESLCGSVGTYYFYCNHTSADIYSAEKAGLITQICEVSGVTVTSQDTVRSDCLAGTGGPTSSGSTVAASTVSSHDAATDCWTAIGGLVYDITSYMTIHPGGKSNLVARLCGLDGTDVFRDYHPDSYLQGAIDGGFIELQGPLSGSLTSNSLSTTYTGITLSTLQSHATTTDCWTRVGDFVYDVTEFQNAHPAGPTVFTCGGDSTNIFRGQHPNEYLTRDEITKYLKGRLSVSVWSDSIEEEAYFSTLTTTTTVLYSDMSSHSSSSDCWVSVHCTVYDVTNFLDDHTGDSLFSDNGGITKNCGTDITNLFDAIRHPNSYLRVATLKGAVKKGRLSGCNENTLHDTSLTERSAYEITATATYTIQYGVTGAAGFTGSTSDIAAAIYGRMGGFSRGFSVSVSSCTAASTNVLQCTMTLGFKDYDTIEDILLFMDHPRGFAKATFQTVDPTATSGPTISVSNSRRRTQEEHQAEIRRRSLQLASQASLGTSSLPQVGIGQVGDHTTSADCWVAVHSKVYDCAQGATSHPGGSLFNKGFCGVDSTSSFNSKHALSYLDAARMSNIGCTQVATLANQMGARLSAASVPGVMPSVTVSLTGGGTEALEAHSSSSDCWMAIWGNVYTAGTTISQHDGGSAVVAALCGIDATASFTCWHGTEELNDAIADWGFALVGTTTSQLGSGCSWSAPANLGGVEGTEVAAHNTASDCWAAINGYVFDLTNYVSKHTGGSGSITSACGTDASSSFNKNHKVGYMTTLYVKGMPVKGSLSSAVPTPSLGNANYPAVSADELAQHNTASNCWVAIHGYVLDVTGFLNRHTGGASTITPSCGADGSASFDGAGHPESYLATMVNNGHATIKGCLGGACGSSGTDGGTTDGGGGTDGTTRECTASEPQPPADVIIDSKELATHNSAADCWQAIGCGVYDVTAYSHSGGQGFITAKCGKDAHASFSGKHPMTYLQVLLDKGAILKGKAQTNTDGGVDRRTPISASELAKHNKANDCWSCINAQVYNLTNFHADHDAGSAVVLPMCGEESTLSYLRAHDMASLDGIQIEGSCNRVAEYAFMIQMVLDGVALFAFIIVPIICAYAAKYWFSVRWQDRWLRRPLAEPKKGAWGHTINGYLEMSWALFYLLVYYLVMTIVFMAVWAYHYLKYYPDEYKIGGAAGRNAVYHICLATLIGTRRFTWSWWLLRLPYERALKTHYVVGKVAVLFVLMHGLDYLIVFEGTLPETVAVSAWYLLITTIVVGVFTVPNIRVHWYGIFRVSHYLAPLIVIILLLHLAGLSAEGVLAPGFYLTIVWTAVAAGFWVFDYLQMSIDAYLYPVKVTEPPVLIPAEGDAAYVCFVVSKTTKLFWGCWMSVASTLAGSTLSHPFTTIVKKTGKEAGEKALMEFVLKVQPGLSWTARLYRAIEKRQQSEKGENSLVGQTSCCPWLYVTGPFGGGLAAFGDLKYFSTMVFVSAGVGVTPVASMVPLFSGRKDKKVHVVWSFRSLGLFRRIAPYFQDIPAESCHFHYTMRKGKGENEAQQAEGSGGEWALSIKNGRPDLPAILRGVREQVSGDNKWDVGVFVCGPDAMVCDVLRTTSQLNKELNGQGLYFHTHSESFQM